MSAAAVRAEGKRLQAAQAHRWSDGTLTGMRTYLRAGRRPAIGLWCRVYGAGAHQPGEAEEAEEEQGRAAKRGPR